jgi:Chaperone of endosialidase
LAFGLNRQRGAILDSNNWILLSAHENILVEEISGDTGAFCSLHFYGNTSENCAAGYANMRLTTNSTVTASLLGVTISGHHFEQSITGPGTYCMFVDGVFNMLVDDVVCLTGGGPLTGVQISSSAFNLRQHYRSIANPNIINPILNDALNGVTFAGVHLNAYSTPDGSYETGPLLPAKDNAYTLGQSGQRWSAIWSANGMIQTSDARLKADVQRLDYGLKELLRLAPISFAWEPGGDRLLGLVAQAVQDVIPEAVVHGTDPEGLLGLKYSSLIPVIINAIRELDERIPARSSSPVRPRCSRPRIVANRS